MNAQPIAVSIKTAAEMLDLHPDTIRASIKDGKLLARKVGRSLRVEVADLTDWYRSLPASSAPVEA